MKLFRLYLYSLLLVGLVACTGTEEVFSTQVANLNTSTPMATAPIVTPPATNTSLPLPVTSTSIPQPATLPASDTITPPPTSSPTDTPVPPTPLPIPQVLDSISLGWIASGFESPVYLTHAGDSRLFIVEQRGTIRILDDAGNIQSGFFLDIRDRVGDSANEQGLLSMAFHPNYDRNRRFFVNYTNNQGHTVVAEYKTSDNPNQADANSEKILLTITQPYSNHNGGQILFGTDGYLYIGMGDGGSQGDPQNNGQNGNTLLGSILRLDIDSVNPYGVPANNPFVEDAGIRNEIWAMGFRNPWRFSFDRLTNGLFIADVGQSSFEEVNFVPANEGAGANFGWNVMEGLHCYNSTNCNTASYILPVTEYGRDEGCSVTGGYVYRGEQFPQLYGNYFFADFCFGNIWSLLSVNGNWQRSLVYNGELNITSFGEDVNGELYILHRGGDIYQIQP